MPPAQRPSLRNAIVAIALAAVFIVGFFPTLMSLHRRWSSWTESYSHGYLLLAVALYLYFDLKRPAPCWLPDVRRWAIWALGALSLVWLIAYLGGVSVLQQLTLLFLVAALLAALVDRHRLWRALRSLGLVVLAIPMWDELLAKPLQIAATGVSGWIVARLFGIPTSIDGFHISIPAGTFEVASGCAGLVFLLSAIALGIVYGQFFLQRRGARIAAVFIAAGLGVLINWIRIVSLILIGQYSHMQSPFITEGHLLFGWYLFSAALVLILLVSHFIAGPHPKIPLTQDDAIPRYSWRRLAAVTLALACGPLLLLVLRWSGNTAVVPAPSASISPYLRQVAPSIAGFISPAINTSYAFSLEPDLTASFVYYSNSVGKGKLISQSNHLFTDDEQVIDETVLAPHPPLPARRQLRVQRKRAALESATASVILVWDWYEIGEAYAASATEGKLQQLNQTLRGNWDGFYIRLALPCREESCTIEQQILARQGPAIYRDLRPELDRLRRSQ